MLSISQLPPFSVRAAERARPAGAAANGAEGRAEDAQRAGGAPAEERTQQGSAKSKDPTQLSDEDKQTVRKLAARDAEVRAHEQAHASTGGAYAGAPSFELQRGPDGQNYAVGGEVPIDISPIPGDPQATITKMLQVKRAALAPSEPSGADKSIAATADSAIVAARRELMTQSSQDAPGQTGSEQDQKTSTGFEAIDPARASANGGSAGAFASVERRSASVAAYSAAVSSGGVGVGLDRHA